ncbi:hypothetical protein [Aeoliella sp. SH292]|uniref:hypothetical protein n=1 Tax=Aeoliella sp. SH292 TaxID=3454464 RepID=UPI003F9C08C7
MKVSSLLLLILLPLAPVAMAQTTEVVVLRNGNILEGQVDRIGDAYRIATGTSEMRLTSRDVERVVPTILDAYACKRIEVREDSAADHITLAMWCIRHELWPQAQMELEEVRKIYPRHPDIAYLERRIEVASSAAVRATDMAALAQAEVPTVDTNAKAAELAQLEQLAATLPEGALQDFSRHIQPILVNGCAAGGCHSTEDARSFQLNRDLIRGVANRESTLKNLQAVWAIIDQEKPEHSPLLMQPAVPHGGLPKPVFIGARQKAQDRMKEWVLLATGRTQPAPLPTDPNAVQLAGHQTPALPGQPAVVDPAAAANPEMVAEEEMHFWEDPDAGAPPEASMPDVRTPIRQGADIKPYEPRDEFDPELFNRQQAAPAGKP